MNNNFLQSKLTQEILGILEMKNSKEKRADFNNEIVNKTNYYQKKYGFNNIKKDGHVFWNDESDAFKHAFGSAQMFFDLG